MALPLISIAMASYGVYNTTQQTGVLGLGSVLQSFSWVGIKMVADSGAVDSAALDEMVSAAKSRVHSVSGRLLNGITGRIEDGTCIFEASAISPDGQHADYARYVEFGHHAGGIEVADAAFFAGTGASALSSRAKGGRDVEAEPFFFPAADEALEKRGIRMQSVLNALSAEGL